MDASATHFPLKDVVRSIWETTQPLPGIAVVANTSERYVRQMVAEKMPLIPASVANEISSYAEFFVLPVTADQTPLVQMSRKLICRATNSKLINEQIGLLEGELESAKERKDPHLVLMMHWQLCYAHSRGATIALIAENEGMRKTHLQRAKYHADKMAEPLGKATLHDPSIMRIVERRNWATTNFLCDVSNSGGKLPNEEQLEKYLAAYDSALAEIADMESGADDIHKSTRRALRLDQLEFLAYLGESERITENIEYHQEELGKSSILAFQLALNSLPDAALSELWKHEDFKSFMSMLNAKVAKRTNRKTN